MEENITYKAPQGKLLRIKADIEDSVIQEITITGDFFIHPEEALLKIEKILQGKRVENIKEIMEEFMAENNVEIVGFTPKDLEEALKKNYKHS
jgi:hypothetical protein